jgi:hypothetical protein
MSSIILVDYENLYNSATNNHRLKMTEKGFENLITHYAEKYDVEDEMVFVACHFESYEGLSKLVGELSYTPVRALELGNNMADGYLIAYGAKELLNIQDDIENVVLIAGDGIYTGLARMAAGMAKKVVVVSWKDSLSNHLTRISKKKVEIEHIEESFDLAEKEEEGWFVSYALLEEEKEIISFLLKTETDQGFQLVALTRIITTWKNPAVVERFDRDFNKVRDFLNQCASNSGFLTKERGPSPKGDKDVWWVKLDRSHLKVQNVDKK